MNDYVESLPPELIGPFAVLFVLMMLLSKGIDLLEKWAKYRATSKPSEGETDLKNSATENVLNMSTSTMSQSKLFLLSFLGAFVFPFVHSLMLPMIIDDENLWSIFFPQTLSNFVTSVVSAALCTFYVAKKWRFAKSDIVAAALLGLGVSAILNLPIAAISLMSVP